MGPGPELADNKFCVCPVSAGCTAHGVFEAVQPRWSAFLEMGYRISFFPSINSSLYLLAYKHIDQAQIQTGFKVKLGKVKGGLEFEGEMGLHYTTGVQVLF